MKTGSFLALARVIMITFGGIEVENEVTFVEGFEKVEEKWWEGLTGEEFNEEWKRRYLPKGITRKRLVKSDERGLFMESKENIQTLEEIALQAQGIQENERLKGTPISTSEAVSRIFKNTKVSGGL
ncbi:MAG: hypothetical protein V1897_04065 [Pseudomonadota bacterium]